MKSRRRSWSNRPPFCAPFDTYSSLPVPFHPEALVSRSSPRGESMYRYWIAVGFAVTTLGCLGPEPEPSPDELAQEKQQALAAPASASATPIVHGHRAMGANSGSCPGNITWHGGHVIHRGTFN